LHPDSSVAPAAGRTERAHVERGRRGRAWTALLFGGLPLVSPAALPAGDSALEEVVVTARRREEVLQDVPVSIAALPREALRARSVASLADLGQLVANLTYGEKVQSGNSAGQVYLRGIGQQDTNSTFNPAVGIYVDGVYLGRAAANDVDLADVARVEVLYGPQGTLFGHNTNGGAINIVTRDADLTAREPDGDVEVDAGSYRSLRLAGHLSVPIAAERAALTLAVTHRTSEGYGTRADGERTANTHRLALRGQLRVAPLTGFEATLRVDRTAFDEHSADYRLVAVRGESTVPMLYAQATPYRYDARWVPADDYGSYATGPNRNAGTVWGASLTLAWHRGATRLQSISAYRQLGLDSDFDPDGSPLAILDVYNSVRQHQFSQELQASGATKSGGLEWTAGLYYFSETAQDNQPANVALEYFHGAANFDPRLHVVNSNVAAYGQAIARLTPALRLTIGARAGHDVAEDSRVVVSYPVPTVEQPFLARSAGWSSFLPRIGLDYHWSADLMGYASVAEGAKNGGFNGRAGSLAEFNRYEPEKVWTGELGLRSEWYGRRLRLNATAFYSTYSDFQILLNRSVTDPATGRPVPFSFVGNMPSAVVRGGEFVLSAVPRAGLTLESSVGIADGAYRRVLSGAPVTTASQFVNTPKATISVATELSQPLGDAGQLVLRLDYLHKTTIQYDYSNSPLVAQRPYGLMNARLTWHLPRRRATFFLYGTNLADVHYAVGGLDDGAGGSLGEVVKLMGPPRQLGAGGEMEF